MNRATSATGWVRNPDGTLGWTWNPITGCLNHVNGLCKGGGFPCYAYRLAHGRLKERYLANTNLANGAKGGVSKVSNAYQVLAVKREGDYADPFYPRFWEERLMEVDVDIKSRGIFVCDMSDLFGIGIPEEWTRKVLDVCQRSFEHRFYLLTKQPQNLIKFSPFPENCWVGVTVCNEAMFSIASNYMTKIRAKVKFYSFEPLLHWDFKADWDKDNECLVRRLKTVDWLIIGAQTKPYKPPEIEWVREIIQAADKAGIPVFLKDNLLPLMRATQPMIEAKDIRQEMPK